MLKLTSLAIVSMAPKSEAMSANIDNSVNTRIKPKKWQQLILVFIVTICLIVAAKALAQTDLNINNTNLIRFGGSVTVAENQAVENAHAFGGSVTISPNVRVLDTAIAFGGDVILKKGHG